MLPFYPMRVTQNGTVFYQTPDGKIGVTNTGIAAGFTLTALLYLFLRFLCVGAVARAKARLSKNDNRNCVLEFIIKNPGSSLYEIARGTGINLGTVRYHLFILGINRKITASQTDGKFVRYFTNSGTYSKDEQLILSLMRREAIGRTLGLMLEKPGISNVEIAKELDIKESVVSRHIKEHAERSIIEKGADGYAVKDEHRQAVADMVRHFFS
jgi:predicted transcriptional regulator